MIQVTSRTARKGTDSPMKLNVADISAFAALRTGGWSLWPMTFTQNRRAARRARKMNKLQPARRPSLPMKTLLRAGGCVGGMGSAGVNVASSFKGFLVGRDGRDSSSYVTPDRKRFVNSVGDFLEHSQ